MTPETKWRLRNEQRLARWLNRHGREHPEFCRLVEHATRTSVFSWVSARASHFQLGPGLAVEAIAGPDSVDGALIVLQELVDLGHAIHVKPCRQCGRWFVARRAAYDFSCSAKCREASLRKTPKGRADRAAYMRKYRQDPNVKLHRHKKGRKKS